MSGSRKRSREPQEGESPSSKKIASSSSWTWEDVDTDDIRALVVRLSQQGTGPAPLALSHALRELTSGESYRFEERALKWIKSLSVPQLACVLKFTGGPHPESRSWDVLCDSLVEQYRGSRKPAEHALFARAAYALALGAHYAETVVDLIGSLKQGDVVACTPPSAPPARVYFRLAGAGERSYDTWTFSAEPIGMVLCPGQQVSLVRDSLADRLKHSPGGSRFTRLKKTGETGLFAAQLRAVVHPVSGSLRWKMTRYDTSWSEIFPEDLDLEDDEEAAERQAAEDDSFAALGPRDGGTFDWVDDELLDRGGHGCFSALPSLWERFVRDSLAAALGLQPLADLALGYLTDVGAAGSWSYAADFARDYRANVDAFCAQLPVVSGPGADAQGTNAARWHQYVVVACARKFRPQSSSFTFDGTWYTEPWSSRTLANTGNRSVAILYPDILDAVLEGT